ncbi:uncharacterized protein LOC119106427 [Pollicipes pollicipes]|uniref:uncharacterized protein LOC119106427 n=1 Tax=Pollicipes pollicipes TaxID=41117 RepID=UPI0018852819|nr:uncharacterized protein LOC119106427 [Pollicipes pollicipes]
MSWYLARRDACREDTEYAAARALLQLSWQERQAGDGPQMTLDELDRLKLRLPDTVEQPLRARLQTALAERRLLEVARGPGGPSQLLALLEQRCVSGAERVALVRGMKAIFEDASGPGPSAGASARAGRGSGRAPPAVQWRTPCNWLASWGSLWASSRTRGPARTPSSGSSLTTSTAGEQRADAVAELSDAVRRVGLDSVADRLGALRRPRRSSGRGSDHAGCRPASVFCCRRLSEGRLLWSPLALLPVVVLIVTPVVTAMRLIEG